MPPSASARLRWRRTWQRSSGSSTASSTSPIGPEIERSGDAPLLALTMGDPCGIGPEVIAKALTRALPAPCVVVGDVAVMRRAVAACGLQWPVAELDDPTRARRVP